MIPKLSSQVVLVDAPETRLLPACNCLFYIRDNSAQIGLESTFSFLFFYKTNCRTTWCKCNYGALCKGYPDKASC